MGDINIWGYSPIYGDRWGYTGIYTRDWHDLRVWGFCIRSVCYNTLAFSILAGIRDCTKVANYNLDVLIPISMYPYKHRILSQFPFHFPFDYPLFEGNIPTP